MTDETKPEWITDRLGVVRETDGWVYGGRLHVFEFWRIAEIVTKRGPRLYITLPGAYTTREDALAALGRMIHDHGRPS